jgi:DNA-directed RNA polymerase subunit RPC12/RpoP
MSDDLISRQAVLDACSQSINILDAMSRIEDLPPVTPKQKTGHWIDTADEINAIYSKHDYKCSKCGKYAEYFIAGTEDWWSCEKPNYCPYCGAKMVDPQESEGNKE